MSNGILESTPRICWTIAIIIYFLGYTIWHNRSQLAGAAAEYQYSRTLNYSVTHSQLQLPPPS